MTDSLTGTAGEDASHSTAGGASPGTMLAELRARRGLTIADIAQRLKFGTRQIEALEADDYARLPGNTFVRGMVRGYARALDSDPAPILAELSRREIPAPAAQDVQTLHVPLPVAPKKRANRVYVVLSALARSSMRTQAALAAAIGADKTRIIRTLDYLVTRPEVDPNRVGYAGVSWGAITGITFAAHDDRIKAMASIVGGGNFMGTIADKVQMPEETVALAKSFDPVYHVALIAPRPLLLLNVTHDQLVPRFFAESLHKAAGKGATKMWLDTDHFFQGVDRYAILGDVITFMRDNLAEKK